MEGKYVVHCQSKCPVIKTFRFWLINRIVSQIWYNMKRKIIIRMVPQKLILKTRSEFYFKLGKTMLIPRDI